MPRCVGDEKDEICRAFGMNNMCYVRYRMNEAEIWYGMDIYNTSTLYMCSVLRRYVICYLYYVVDTCCALFFLMILS